MPTIFTMLLPIEMDRAGFEAEFNHVESKFTCAGITVTTHPSGTQLSTTVKLLKLLPPDGYLLHDPGQAKYHNENKRFASPGGSVIPGTRWAAVMRKHRGRAPGGQK